MSDYDFTAIARDVALREDIHDCKLELQSSSKKGDGYTGTVLAATLLGTNKKLEVVFKFSLRDPKAHDTMPLHEIYTNEITFYKTVAPALKQFQREHNIKNPFDNMAEYYGCVSNPLNECIVLENLKTRNFDMWDRKQLMNAAHLELAIKTFGKFHATSMAMKVLNPELYMNISRNLDTFNLQGDYAEKVGMWRQVSEIIANNADIFDPNAERHYLNKVENYRQNISKTIKYITSYHDQYDAILQGDCWCNNAMYQYENLSDRSKPKDVKLLDWQVVKTGSVVMDLSYFFYSIASQESMDNLDYVLKLYHDALAAHLKAFNLNADKVFPFEVLVARWKEHAKFGLSMAVLLRKFMLMDSDDAPDFAESADFPEVRINEEQEDIFRKQIKQVFVHFVDRQFI